jgi:uncharacterized alkaline shock family protein YloU
LVNVEVQEPTREVKVEIKVHIEYKYSKKIASSLLGCIFNKINLTWTLTSSPPVVSWADIQRSKINLEV